MDCGSHQVFLQTVACRCQVSDWANTGYQFMSNESNPLFPFSGKVKLTVQDCNVGEGSELCHFFHLCKFQSSVFKDKTS